MLEGVELTQIFHSLQQVMSPAQRSEPGYTFYLDNLIALPLR